VMMTKTKPAHTAGRGHSPRSAESLRVTDSKSLITHVPTLRMNGEQVPVEEKVISCYLMNEQKKQQQVERKQSHIEHTCCCCCYCFIIQGLIIVVVT